MIEKKDFTKPFLIFISTFTFLFVGALLYFTPSGIRNLLEKNTPKVEADNQDFNDYLESKLVEKIVSEVLAIQERENKVQKSLLVIPEDMSSGMYTEGNCPKGNVDDNLTLAPVNKKDSVGEYVPPRLVEVNHRLTTKHGRSICLIEPAALALEEMMQDAKDVGLELIITSGYRDPDLQFQLYKTAIDRNRYLGSLRVAPAYHSEHQLGTTVDLSGMTLQQASASGTFADSPEGKWTMDNAHKYGFIMSYPKGKADITGYKFEAWHYRWIGKENAEIVHSQSRTLHEVLVDDNTRVLTQEEVNRENELANQPLDPETPISELAG